MWIVWVLREETSLMNTDVKNVSQEKLIKLEPSEYKLPKELSSMILLILWNLPEIIPHQVSFLENILYLVYSIVFFNVVSLPGGGRATGGRKQQSRSVSRGGNNRRERGGKSGSGGRQWRQADKKQPKNKGKQKQRRTTSNKKVVFFFSQYRSWKEV